MVLNTCHVDGNMHGNDMQMRLCIVKLSVVRSIHVNFVGGVGVDMHVRTIFP